MSVPFDVINTDIKQIDYEVEPAMEVNPQERVVVPGINVMHNDAGIPVFFSVKDLRDMADAAEEIVRSHME